MKPLHNWNRNLMMLFLMNVAAVSPFSSNIWQACVCQIVLCHFKIHASQSQTDIAYVLKSAQDC